MHTITVLGTPAPQGSKRHVGRGVLVESSAKVKPWREAVKSAVVDAGLDQLMIDAPVILEITFTVPKPAGAPKTRTTWPMRKPDLDKLLRSTLDGLTEAGVLADDARVVELTGRKVYPAEGVDALRTPGAVIHVWQQAEKAAA